MPPTGPSGLHLVWPTVVEVRNSMEGWFAGGSIPGPSKNVNRPFLRPYFCRWVCTSAPQPRGLEVSKAPSLLSQHAPHPQ